MEQRSTSGIPEEQDDRAERERWTLSGPGDDLYFSHHPFSKHFFAALHILLISCSRQDVLTYFAHFEPRHRDFLYNVFTLTVKQIRENIVAEFRSICEETRLLEALDHASSREFLTSTGARPSISPIDVIREVCVKRKLEEVNMMKQTLQMTKEHNGLLAAQLEGIRAKVGEAKDVRSVDAIIDKISSINLKLVKLMGGDSSSRKLT